MRVDVDEDRALPQAHLEITALVCGAAELIPRPARAAVLVAKSGQVARHVPLLDAEGRAYKQTDVAVRQAALPLRDGG